jgi:hypothetical protein
MCFFAGGRRNTKFGHKDADQIFNFILKGMKAFDRIQRGYWQNDQSFLLVDFEGGYARLENFAYSCK